MPQTATADDQKHEQHKCLDYIRLWWKSQKNNEFLIRHCMTVHLQHNNAGEERPLHLRRRLTCYEAASE